MIIIVGFALIFGVGVFVSFCGGVLYAINKLKKSEELRKFWLET